MQDWVPEAWVHTWGVLMSPVPSPHDIPGPIAGLIIRQIFSQRNCRNKAATSCPTWVWMIHPRLNQRVPSTGALCKGTAGSFCCGPPFDSSHGEMGQKGSGNGRDLAVNRGDWSPWEVGDYRSPLVTETTRIISIASTTENPPILSALPFQISLPMQNIKSKNIKPSLP